MARPLALPTEDSQIKFLLRKFGEPICLFGEDVLDRRDRLKQLMTGLSEDDMTRILHSVERKEPTKTDLPSNKTWYHEGPQELRNARLYLADYSLPRAQHRLKIALEKSKKPPNEKAKDLQKRQDLHKSLQTIQLFGSQTAGLRAVSFCEFSPDSQHVITSAWDGQVCIWSVPDLQKEVQLIGHGNQVGCARFHPLAYKDGMSTLTAASCDFDGRVLIWAANKEEPLTELEKHETRVSRLAFHPSGRFLATCCHDASWRMHDLEINKEILFQEGHSKAVFDVEFQNDGSLALTGGYDCYGRTWDLRTGKCIMFLEGHQQAIHTVGWHPNGYYMATGSADNSCKIWDMRMRRCIYTIPAHKSLVSRLKIDAEGDYMVTSSFDNLIKIWTTNGYQPLKTLEGHAMGIIGVDISPDNKWIASASKDRSLKIWTSSDIIESLT